MSADIRPDRVAIYIRWSTDEQTDGTTLAEQQEGCEFYVRSQGWKVTPALIFVDDGYSGGSLERPAMRKLRALIQTDGVDCVVVLKIDRLSRNIVDATQLVLVEWKDRCHLRCVRQPIDTTTETGRMIFSILATFADFERAQISERTFSGRIRRLKEGKAYGGPYVPFGLRATGAPGVRTLDPDKAPLVAELFRKVRTERAGIHDLVEWLTGQGVVPPGGGRWRGNTIRHILSNPIYAGRIVYGWAERQPLDAQQRPGRRGSPLIDVPAATVPAIVSPAEFAAVQSILAERSAFHRKHRRAADGQHLLSGIATCRCGGGIQVHYSRGERYYICSNRINYGPQACIPPSGVLLARVVEEAVVRELLALFGEHHCRTQAARRLLSHTAREATRMEREAERAAAELERLEARLAELRAAASLGDLPLDEWRDLRSALESKRAERSAARAELQERGRCLRAGISEESLIQRMAQLDRWTPLSPQERKHLLREMAEAIELYKPKGHGQPYELKMTWRFRPPGAGA